MLGARQGTEIAGDAHGLIGIGIDIESRRATIALGDLRPLQRILLGIGFLGILIAEGDPETLQQVDEKYFAEQVWHSHRAQNITILAIAQLALVPRIAELSEQALRTPEQEDAMKAYLSHLPPRTWALAVISAILLAYPIARIVVPAVVHAMVPDVVETVLKVI
jgi:hypothetical protein